MSNFIFPISIISRLSVGLQEEPVSWSSIESSFRVAELKVKLAYCTTDYLDLLELELVVVTLNSLSVLQFSGALIGLHNILNFVSGSIMVKLITNRKPQLM